MASTPLVTKTRQAVVSQSGMEVREGSCPAPVTAPSSEKLGILNQEAGMFAEARTGDFVGGLPTCAVVRTTALLITARTVPTPSVGTSEPFSVVPVRRLPANTAATVFTATTFKGTTVAGFTGKTASFTGIAGLNHLGTTGVLDNVTPTIAGDASQETERRVSSEMEVLT